MLDPKLAGDPAALVLRVGFERHQPVALERHLLAVGFQPLVRPGELGLAGAGGLLRELEVGALLCQFCPFGFQLLALLFVAFGLPLELLLATFDALGLDLRGSFRGRQAIQVGIELAAFCFEPLAIARRLRFARFPLHLLDLQCRAAGGQLLLLPGRAPLRSGSARRERRPDRPPLDRARRACRPDDRPRRPTAAGDLRSGDEARPELLSGQRCGRPAPACWPESIRAGPTPARPRGEPDLPSARSTAWLRSQADRHRGRLAGRRCRLSQAGRRPGAIPGPRSPPVRPPTARAAFPIRRPARAGPAASGLGRGVNVIHAVCASFQERGPLRPDRARTRTVTLTQMGEQLAHAIRLETYTPHLGRGQIGRDEKVARSELQRVVLTQIRLCRKICSSRTGSSPQRRRRGRP